MSYNCHDSGRALYARVKILASFATLLLACTENYITHVLMEDSTLGGGYPPFRGWKNPSANLTNSLKVALSKAFPPLCGNVRKRFIRCQMKARSSRCHYRRQQNAVRGRLSRNGIHHPPKRLKMTIIRHCQTAQHQVRHYDEGLVDTAFSNRFWICRDKAGHTARAFVLAEWSTLTIN